MREAVTKFAEAMEQRLQARDASHPLGWAASAPEDLLLALENKVDATHYGILKNTLPAAQVQKRLVDVANYAMMLYDNLGAPINPDEVES